MPDDPVPPQPPVHPPSHERTDAPDSGEIEWAGGFIPNPPAPGEAAAGGGAGLPEQEEKGQGQPPDPSSRT